MNYDFNICHDEDGIDHGVDLFGIEDGAQEKLEAYLIETLYQLNPRYTLYVFKLKFTIRC